MKKPHTKSPSNSKARLTHGEQGAQNIANAMDRMLADSAAGKDLAGSAKKLREAIANSCREHQREWVIKFGTGIVPSNKPLSAAAVTLLTTLEKEVKRGKVDIKTLNELARLLLDRDLY